LARRLEVSSRSIRNYIMMLQDLGIPVEATYGRHGAYRLRAGYKLPPLIFTNDEAVVLVVSMLAVRRLGLRIAAPNVESALAKLERGLPAAVRARVHALQSAVVFDLDAPSSQSEVLVVAMFSAAVQAGQRIWFRYRSFRNEETERELDPYGVVCQQGRWYAVGFDHSRQALRTFRLDRVLASELGAAQFEPVPSFDTLAHVERSIALAPIGWKVEVLLETTLAAARRQLSTLMATFEEVADGVLLRHHVYHPSGLDRFAQVLVGLDCPLVVIEPPEIRTALQRLATRAAQLATRTLAGGGNVHQNAGISEG
jgi:predicted DNA-binding transcriptional regulator YafY